MFVSLTAPPTALLHCDRLWLRLPVTTDEPRWAQAPFKLLNEILFRVCEICVKILSVLVCQASTWLCRLLGT